MVQAKEILLKGFKNHEVAMMNSFKSGHDLLKKAVQAKNVPARLAIAMEEQLKKKDFSMPEFKLVKDGSVQFNLENKNYKLIRDDANQFRLNGKLVDTNSSEWKVDARHQHMRVLGFPFLVETAEAEVSTATIVIISMIVIVWGVACSVPGVKIDIAPEGAKRLTVNNQSTNPVDEFIHKYTAESVAAMKLKAKQALTQARASLCGAGACGAACASTPGAEFDHLDYVIKLCPELAKKFSGNKDIEKQSIRVNGRQPKSDLMRKATEFYSQRIKQLNLEEFDQQAVSSIVSDNPEFMKLCAQGAFELDEAKSIPKGNSNVQ